MLQAWLPRRTHVDELLEEIDSQGTRTTFEAMT